MRVGEDFHMNKKIIITIFSLFLIILLVGNVLAITAKIGNARMILRVEVGDKIERSIKVINDNAVAVDILLTASGDLEEDIKIIDEEFRLDPGEEKNARFEIDVKEPGSTESNINIRFSPTDGKNGAGISSTIIIIASGEGSLEEEDDEEIIEEEDEDIIIVDDEGEVIEEETDEGENKPRIFGNSITGNIIVKDTINFLGKGIALIITGIIFLVFIVLLIVYYTKYNKKSKKQTKKVKTKSKKKVKKSA